jgi:uncharacterized protein
VQCPVDGNVLTMTERSGVEIDYCPQCRGVWLDRGELDKLIDRSGPSGRDRGRDRDDGDDRRGGPGAKQKKKGSFLSEIFDFGG